MSKPQLLAPRGSIDPNQVTSEPGLIISYSPGFNPPTPLTLQNIPGYVIQELDRCEKDMEDISAQHEVSKGSVPSGVTAGTAIAYLQEADDSKLAHTVASLEEGVERLGNHFLSHVQQFWTRKRKVQIVGEDGQFEINAFDASDLKGAGDLNIVSGSAAPRSKAAKQAFITDLAKTGFITPQQALKYLEMPEASRLYEETQLDYRQVQRENERMLQGEEVPINTWDNQLVHVEEHNKARKRQSFEMVDDNIKQIFEAHVEMHKEKIKFDMQQEAMAQGMAQGMAPGMEGGALGAEGMGTDQPGAGNPTAPPVVPPNSSAPQGV